MITIVSKYYFFIKYFLFKTLIFCLCVSVIKPCVVL